MASRASESLVWLMVRNNHAHLMKRRNVRRPFSTEANNLKGVNTFRFNGFVQRSTLGVVADPTKKGAVLVTTKKGTTRLPHARHSKIQLIKGKRRAVHTILNVVRCGGRRKELRGIACRRAVAITRSLQEPKPRRNKK